MTLPNVDLNLLEQPTLDKVQAKALDHPPRILLLYGSNRECSYSRLAVMEAGRILEYFGAEVKIFHPKGLPLPEDADTEHPKVKELHDLLAWFGMVIMRIQRPKIRIWFKLLNDCEPPLTCIKAKVFP